MKNWIVTLLLLVMALPLSAQVNDRFEEKKKPRPDSSEVEMPERSPAEKVVQDDIPEAGKAKIWDKLVIGGDLSFSFGSYTAIYAAPAVGYRFTDKLVAGPGFIYQYFKWNQVPDQNGNLVGVDSYSNVIYGPKLFVNYAFTENFYAATQYEYLNHDLRTIQNSGAPTVENRWTSVLFLEAGLRFPMGSKGFGYGGFRVNVLHDFTSPYTSSWFPVVGFFF